MMHAGRMGGWIVGADLGFLPFMPSLSPVGVMWY